MIDRDPSAERARAEGRRGGGAHRHRAPAARQRGLLLRALAGVRRRGRDGRRAGGRGRRRGSRRRRSTSASATTARPSSSWRASRTEANRRIFELAREDSSRSGMGTTLTGALLSRRRGQHRARRRQPRLPLSRRRAAAADPRPLAGRGAAPPGPADAARRPRSIRSARSSRARSAPSPTSSSTSTPTRRAAATCSCSAATASPAWSARTALREILAESDSLRDGGRSRWCEEANEMGGRDNITVVALPGRRGRGRRRPGPTARRRDETVVRPAHAESREAGHGAAQAQRLPAASAAAESAPRARQARAAGARGGADARSWSRSLGPRACWPARWSGACGRDPQRLLRRPGRSRAGDALPGRAVRAAARHRALRDRATSARCRRARCGPSSAAGCSTTSCARATTRPTSCAGWSRGSQ